MKEVRDWKERDLINLPPGEFDWFEAKGRRGIDLTLPNVDENQVRETLSKAVSAFANSGGGTLCYGLVKIGNQWQVDDGGVSLTVKTPNTREWLEDVIPRIVEPELRRFNVYEITARGKQSQIEGGRGVFLIDIPDSEQAPHQAQNNKYYGRIGGKSKPLGHRFVADIFGRRKDPQLTLEFRMKASYYHERSFGIEPRYSYGATTEISARKRKVELRVLAKNIGRVYAQYINCFIYIPEEFADEEHRNYRTPHPVSWSEGRYFKYSEDNTHRDVIKVNLTGPSEYGPSRYEPILPGMTLMWSIDMLSTLTIDQLKQSTGEIHWRLYADNAALQSGRVPLSEIEFIEKKPKKNGDEDEADEDDDDDDDDLHG